jgi:hypothetical protein
LTTPCLAKISWKGVQHVTHAKIHRIAQGSQRCNAGDPPTSPLSAFDSAYETSSHASVNCFIMTDIIALWMPVSRGRDLVLRSSGL